MSSQGDRGIPLWHMPSGVGYKLLELPADLVAQLEGDNPPTLVDGLLFAHFGAFLSQYRHCLTFSSRLTLESSPTAALLKAADKTYSLRQKNTSNALILMEPAENAAQSSQVPERGLGAISTVHETIELVPEAGDGPPAAAARGKWHEKFGRTR